MSHNFISITIEFEVDHSTINFIYHEEDNANGTKIQRQNSKNIIQHSPLIKKVISALNNLAESDPDYLTYKITSPKLLSKVLNLHDQINVEIIDSKSSKTTLNHMSTTTGPLEFTYLKDLKENVQLYISNEQEDLLYNIKHISFFSNHLFVFNNGTCFIQNLNEPKSQEKIKQFLTDLNTPNLSEENFLASIKKQKLKDHIKLIKKSTPKEYIKSLTIERSLFKLKGSLKFSHQGLKETWQQKDSNALINQTSGATFKRCFKTEKNIENELTKLGFYQAGNFWNLNVKNPDDLVMTLQQTGWKIYESNRKKGKTEINYLKGQLNFKINYNTNWFDIRGSVKFGDDHIPLENLISRIKKNESTITLSNNRAGVIPLEWKAELENLIEDYDEKSNSIKIQKEKVGKLTSIFNKENNVEYDSKSQDLINKILNFEKISKVECPKNLKATLRNYQEAGISWLNFLDEFNFSGILADDMGLGKTIQVLTHILIKKNNDEEGKFLVVVPKSLLFNWEDEILKFTPSIKSYTFHGNNRIEGFLKNDADIILTTYGTLRSSIEIFENISFNMVILDESQAIKNPTTKTFKAVTLLKSNNRLCMTGTPIENHLGELWSQFKFLSPDLLGSKLKFETEYIKNPKEKDLIKLRSLIFPFILRRKKEEVAKDLPAKVEQSIYCEMDPEQERFYNQLKESIKNELMSKVTKDGLNKSKIVIFEALLRLRQAACHTKLIQKNAEKGTSGKLQTLIEMVSEIISENHKILIFSQFTSMLKIIKEHLDTAKIPTLYLDGSTNNRGQLVKEFQSSTKAQAFLISLKAGGVGLNLTAAEYIFIFDPWWNPAAEMQAIDRAHRIGQTNTVFAYKLIAKNTIEEKIIKLQEKKKAIVDQIITSEKSLMKDLTNDDLKYLFS